MPGPLRRDVQHVRNVPVGFPGAAQFEGAPDRFGRPGLFAPAQAGALPGAVGGVPAVRPEHRAAYGARARLGRVLPPPPDGFPEPLGLAGYLRNPLAGNAHRLADRLERVALLQHFPGLRPPGGQAFRPLRRPPPVPYDPQRTAHRPAFFR